MANGATISTTIRLKRIARERGIIAIIEKSTAAPDISNNLYPNLSITGPKINVPTIIPADIIDAKILALG